MADLRAACSSERLRRCLLALAIAASLLLGVAQPARAAEVTTPVPTHDGTTPEFTLQGFRWDRTVVPVYYNWEGGACVFAGNNLSGSATAIAPEVLLQSLQVSIAQINTQLRSGLQLELAGPATHAELCSTSQTRPIVVGFGTIEATGQALSFASTRPGSIAVYRAARVFLSSANSFVCDDAPRYRNLEHTMTHELLHAIGIGHSEDATAIMAPSYVFCRTSALMRADDIAAVAALYPPTLPLPVATPVVTITPTPTPTPAAAGAATGIGFATAVRFAPTGQALAVYLGGPIENLDATARAAGATGVWVQDRDGRFRLLVVSGPGFLRDEFRAAFPQGLPTNIAVTLVR